MGIDAEHGHVVTAHGGCVFCAIVARRAAASIVLERPRAIAFASLRQQVPGHVLVVPRAHVETIYDLAADDAAALLAAAIEVARAMRDEFAPEGLSLWQSNGPAAFQEIPHVHLHVQPRRSDDGLLQVYPDTPSEASREELDALAAQLRARLSH